MATVPLDIVTRLVNQTGGGVGGALRNLGKLDRATSALNRGFAGLQNMLKRGLVVGAAAATTAIAGLTAGVIKLTQAGQTFVPIRDSFMELTAGITGGGEAMLKALQEAGNGMISNRDLMQNWNAAAQLVGVEFAEQLPGAMQYLQKVAGATGESMSFLMQSLVRGVGRLSPMILDNLGIQVNLTEANEAYAASIGKTVGELTKAEQQTALTNQVMQLLKANTDALELPSAPIQQFTTTLANLRDELGARLLPIVTPVLEAFTGLATVASERLVGAFEGLQIPLQYVGLALAELISGDLPGFFNRLSVAAYGLLEQLGAGRDTLDTVNNLFGAIRSVISDDIDHTPWQALVEVIGAVSPGAAETLATIGEIGAQVADVGGKVWAFIEPFISAEDVLLAVAAVAGTVLVAGLLSLASAMAPVIAAAAAVVAGVKLVQAAMSGEFDGALASARAFAGRIGEALAPVVERIQGALSTLGEVIGPAIGAVVDTVAPMLQSFVGDMGAALEGLAPLWDAIKNAVEAIAPIVGGVLVGAFLTAGTIISGVAGALAAAIPRAVETIIATLTGLLNTVASIANAIVAFFKGIVAGFTGDAAAWEAANEALADALTGIWNGIVATITGLGQGLSDTLAAIVGGLVDGIIGFFQNLYTALVGGSIVPDMVAGIQGAIEGMVSFITGAISGFVGAVLGFFEGLRDDATTAFETMIANAEGAVEGGIQTLTTAAENVVGGIIGAFTAVYGEFTGIGQTIIDSIGEGIEAAKSAIRGKVEGVANLLPGWLKSFLGISSPAPEFVAIGRTLMESVALGTAQEAGAAQRSMVRAAGAVVDPFLARLQAAKAEAGGIMGELAAGNLPGMAPGRGGVAFAGAGMVARPAQPATQAPIIQISVDARGAAAPDAQFERAVERAVERALAKLGKNIDTQLRTT